MSAFSNGRRDIRLETASFDGIVMSTLSYGALTMVYIQVLRSLITRPKRGRVFWGITIYSALLFLLATLAVGGKIKYAESVYVTFPMDGTIKSMEDYVPSRIFQRHASMTINVLGRVCTTLSPWVGDAFLIYRVMVVWSYNLWFLVPILPIYFAHIALSIPLIIADSKLNEIRWALRSHLYAVIFHSLCVSLNIMCSVMITVRLVTMRKKLEVALGRLHASFYTSFFSIIVESGAFATLWGIVFLSTLTARHWSRSAFSQPYYYIIAITRMLIILKMAQNKAWCRDIVSAAEAGVLEWEVTSAHTLELEDASKLQGMKFSDPPRSASTSILQ
ncbi:hypothetical protein AGABI2DRAFT_194342 [Agaricus bisporus var. bisporus H97]|uniref:hypothetical protein n=1 Tax=Agaricus bisporus var. bisporus (strain H97 / ATCC MYA-4626 / FGSC 10389) TaxID=936046 RepID=UPI00029F584C|nr:hypothetical protein AGABI2DRAFT_194342 [Agaricus bisporus var. bisporus H97]EKV45408.1 hypothetical protein AGABI2DRAFT_194342 [Agaricus bisporus var. bisporus H97]